MVSDVISTRRSIRKYTEQPISDEQIHDILEAGFWAPTAMNKQEVRYVVVKNREMLQRMAEVNRFAGMTKDCAFAVVVGYEDGINNSFAQVDAGAAIENMLLQANSMGIGSVWCGLMPDTEKGEAYKELLQIPENFKTIATVQFGYPAEERSAESRYDEKKVMVIE